MSNIPPSGTFFLIFAGNCTVLLLLELAAMAYPNFGDLMQNGKPPRISQIAAAQGDYGPMLKGVVVQAVFMAAACTAMISITKIIGN